MKSRSTEQAATPRTTDGRAWEQVWVSVWMGLIVLSPLAAGGAATVARTALGVLVVGFGVAFLAWSAWRRRPVCVPAASGVMLAAAVWTMFQTRVPAGWLGSPLHGQVTEYLGVPATISLAPVYAPLGALGWLAMAMAMVVSSTLLSVPGRLSRGWLAVAGAGWVTLLVGVVHVGMGWRGLYGLSTSDLALPHPHSAPFVNANQAGSLLAMSMVAGGLLAASSSGRWARAAGAATVVVLLPAVFWMRAGSAAAGLIVCGVVGGLSWLVYRQIGVRVAIRAFWGMLVMVCVVVAAVAWVLPTSQILPGTLHPSLGKSQLWNHALTQILRSPWAGTGYGSSGDVLAGMATGRFEAYYTMVESQPLQLGMDLGIPFSVLLVAAFAVPLVRGSVRESSRSSQRRRLLLLLPLPLIVVDSLLGVGLSAMSVALSATVLSGSPTGFSLRSRSRETPSRNGWLWGAIGVALLLAAWGAGQLPRAMERARQPWPTEWLSSATPPSPQEVRERATEQPALLTVWFVDALVSEQAGDETRAALIRRLMNERAPEAMLTRRLRLAHALRVEDVDAACADIRALAELRSGGLDVSILEPEVARWYTCIPDQESEQQWWFDQLSRSSSSAQVLSTALLALRESTVPWVGARAAALASHELEFAEEALFFASEHGRLAPRTQHHVMDALELAALLGDTRGARILLERPDVGADLGQLATLAEVTLDTDEWWRSERDAATGAELHQRLDDLRIVYLFGEPQESLFLAVRAMVAFGTGDISGARVLMSRASGIDPRDRRVSLVRAAIQRSASEERNRFTP